MEERIASDKNKCSVVKLGRAQNNGSAPVEGSTSAMTREKADWYVSTLSDEEVICLDALLSYLEQKHPQAQIPLETSGTTEL